jgi:hypothetical protein
LPHLHGQLIDTPEISSDFEIGIIRERDGQRATAEFDTTFRPVDRLTKFSVGIGSHCQISAFLSFAA